MGSGPRVGLVSRKCSPALPKTNPTKQGQIPPHLRVGAVARSNHKKNAKLIAMKLSAPRGTQDILPNQIRYWQQIESCARTLFEHYRYQEIRTPIFESTALFTQSIGDSTDIVEKEMYTFTDKGNRSLTLRPEGTASIVRAYIEHNMAQLDKNTKLYYIGPMFRYERPQAGRYRQFHQAGIENLGSEHPFADAEVISMGVRLFDRLGLPGLSVSINSVGCPVCRPVIEERIKQFIGQILDKLCTDCNRRYHHQPLRILDCKKQTCKPYFSGMPDIRKSLCEGCKDHFNSVLESLASLRIPTQVDPLLVRGLAYYTRTTFEIISNDLGAQNAVCGGGRYDRLVEQMGGPKTPAVGMAFGIERTSIILEKLNPGLAIATPINVYIIALHESLKSKCFSLLDQLRKAGISCDMDHTQTAFKPQLRQADKLGAAFAIIYGEEEAEKQTVLLKNMKARTQEEIPISKLVKMVSHELKL